MNNCKIKLVIKRKIKWYDINGICYIYGLYGKSGKICV